MKINNRIIKLSILIYTLLLSGNTLSLDFSYQKFIIELKSFSTLFQQVVSDEEGKLVQKNYGNMIYKKPKKFRIEYVMPNNILLVSDGDFLTTYDKELNQVVISKIDDESNKIIEMLSDFDSIKRKYIYSTHQDNKDIFVEFIPKDSSTSGEIFLVINNGRIKEINFYNEINQKVTVKFDKFEKNMKIKSSVFNFKIPKEADVLVNKSD